MRFYISFRAITQGKSRKIKIFRLTQPMVNSTIRAHIIENIPFLDKDIFEKLLERTKDVDKEVRSVCWQKLADLHFWKYTSSSRLLPFFLRGLNDKYEKLLLL
jgi:hypothetical protein